MITIICAITLDILSFNNRTLTVKNININSISKVVILEDTNILNSFISSFLLNVALLNTNLLFVIYANTTAQIQDIILANINNMLLLISKIKDKIKYVKMLTKVVSTPTIR